MPPLAKVHVCHADGCDRECPPQHLFCRGHWMMLAAPIRHLVTATATHLRVGGRPSTAWFAAARAAKAYVATMEAHGEKL